MKFKSVHPQFDASCMDQVESFLWESDPRPAKEQFNKRYNYGGGWRPFKGFEMKDGGIQYPDDPLMPLLATGQFRDETINFYNGSWVAIVQKDGSFEISRMD